MKGQSPVGELRPNDRSRCAEHGGLCFPRCARPTGGRYCHTPAILRNASREQSEGRAASWVTSAAEGHYKGRNPVEPRLGRSGCYSSSMKVISTLTL